MGTFLDRVTIRRLPRGDAGFTLVEVTISLVLLTIVMSSALSLFVRALGNADIQAQRQQAITIANDQLEQVRAVPVVDLVDGRTLGKVSNLWTWDPALVGTLSVLTYDPAATAASVPLVAPVKTLPKADYDNVSFTVRTYIDVCYLPTTGSGCTATPVGLARPMFRITVSVAWSPGNTRQCDETTVKVLTGADANNRCQEFVVSTLRDKSTDATFNTN